MTFPRVPQRGIGDPGLEAGLGDPPVRRGGGCLGGRPSQRRPLPPPTQRRPQSRAEPPRLIRWPRGARLRYIRAGLLYKVGLVGRGAAGPGPGEGLLLPLFPSPPHPGEETAHPPGAGSLEGSREEGEEVKWGEGVGETQTETLGILRHRRDDQRERAKGEVRVRQGWRQSGRREPHPPPELGNLAYRDEPHSWSATSYPERWGPQN